MNDDDIPRLSEAERRELLEHLQRMAREQEPDLQLSEVPHVRVRVIMRSEHESGRHGPFVEGYSPHFVVADHDEWLGVRAIECPGPVAPGDTADVVFGLLYHPAVDYSALQPGREFAIHEGARTIASGTVLSLHIPPNPNATGNAS